ncbi:MAG: caspase family protein [Lewinellaceae bacterium]|nr:caspase family protein [Phaeodactylibacter sp.]MCB9036971.1 caspase family protein [Lewinellaceae bacterium]
MRNISLIFALACLFINGTLHAQCQEGDCSNGQGTYRFSSGARYIGQFKDGKSNGIGVCYWPDGSRYEGEWADGLPHGKGAKTLSLGRLQTGWFQEGRYVGKEAPQEFTSRSGRERSNDDRMEGCISGNCFNGYGVYVFPSKAVYTGEFKEGEIFGHGICHYSDGSKYEGEWVRRHPNGRGTMTYPDGSKRTGLWQLGQPVDEYGRLLDAYLARQEAEAQTTDIQAGCLSGECYNGRGAFAYIDGSRYEGQFRNGKPDGFGVFLYPNGDRYTGNLQNGVPHGRGELRRANGQLTLGQWLDGEYLGAQARPEKGCIYGNCQDGHGTYIFKDGNKYIGFFRNGLPHGRGTVFYTNGERYEGEMGNAQFNGYGTLFMKDGSAVSGHWKDGAYAGAEKPLKSSAPSYPTVQQQEEAPQLEVWAVVIGISSYNHMPVLRYTDDDAYQMYAFLKSPEGGALDDEHIRILVDEEATLQNIKSTMTSLFGQAGPNDLIMLYFSGHGLRGSFLPYDFDGYHNKLYHEDLNAIMKRSPAKFKLCIADACHSGSLLAMRGGTQPQLLANYYNSLAKANPGTALIMSSKSDETSLESSGLRQGVFSHFLIRGLKGEADANNDKRISVQELYEFVNLNVRTYTSNMQSPLIQGDYDPDMTVGVRR